MLAKLIQDNPVKELLEPTVVFDGNKLYSNGKQRKDGGNSSPIAHLQGG